MREGEEAEWTVAAVGGDVDLDLRMAQDPVNRGGAPRTGVTELGKEQSELLAVTAAREPDTKGGAGGGRAAGDGGG